MKRKAVRHNKVARPSRRHSTACRKKARKGITPLFHRRTRMHGEALEQNNAERVAPVSVSLRPYQQRFVDDALTANTLVVLPTGSGKTLVAAETAKRVFPGRSIFFVPTQLLVSQQAAAVAEWSGLRVRQYMGGMSTPVDGASWDVLVSTPKAFQMLQARSGTALAWTSFSLVIFDEVHHVLKEHPYRKLAALLSKSSSPKPRVLGLSASLTYSVGAARIEAAVQRLCSELQIERLCTADAEELRNGGYHRGGESVTPEIQLYDNAASSIGTVPESERRPHLMQQTFAERIKNGTATPFALRLVTVITALECGAIQEYPKFVSPRSGRGVKEWGEYAHKLGQQENKNVLESSSSSKRHCIIMLEHYYEALRLLVVSWEEAEDAATTLLKMNGMHEELEHSKLPLDTTRTAVTLFWNCVGNAPFLRFEHLASVLLSKLDSIPQLRCIVFVQQRVMTHILEHVVCQHPSLRHRLTTACLYATSSPATASLSISRSQAAQRLSAFANGRVNLLLSTVVAEEGMDVPAANCVIRFDVVQHAVSHVQGRGRARQEDSSLVVLAERADRPTAVLQAAEQEQARLLRTIQPRSSSQGPDAAAIAAQVSREKNALSHLIVAQQQVNARGALSILNTFCAKTKVVVSESYFESERRYEIVYESCLRRVVGSSANNNSKSKNVAKIDAKREAALDLLQKLKEELELRS